jgi:hypothetical protein
MATIMTLLYQSGYITIKDYNDNYNYYTLDIPNKEVKESRSNKIFDSIIRLHPKRCVEFLKQVVSDDEELEDGKLG